MIYLHVKEKKQRNGFISPLPPKHNEISTPGMPLPGHSGSRVTAMVQESLKRCSGISLRRYGKQRTSLYPRLSPPLQHLAANIASVYEMHIAPPQKSSPCVQYREKLLPALVKRRAFLAHSEDLFSLDFRKIV